MKNKDPRTFGVEEEPHSNVFKAFDQALANLYMEGKTETITMSMIQDTLEAELANVKHTKEVGVDGLYYQMGLSPQNKDVNTKYTNGLGRGLYGNLGAYDEVISGDSTFDKGINNIVTSLSTGRFEIDIDEYTDEDELNQARLEQELLYKCLFGPEGGWDMFLREWSEALKYGFSIWEVIFEKNTPIVKKYAFRRANTVYQWMFDEDERNLLGVKFTGLTGKFVEIPSSDLMIYSHERTGTDFEGQSLARKVAGYLLIKKYLMKIHAASIEFNATGMKVYKGEKDSSDNARVVAILSKSTAERNGVVSIGTDESIEYLSGQGNIPAVESMIRYYDEQIAKIFDNEGSLLGLNQVGSYALATESSKKAAAASQYYGKLVCSLFNGKEPFNNIIEKIIDAAFPDRTLKTYPKMTFKVSDTTELDQDRINTYVQSGMPITYDDINMIRKSMGMEPIIIDNSSQIVMGAGANIPRDPNQSFSVRSILSETQHKASCSCGVDHNVDLALDEEQEALRAYWEASERNIGKTLYAMAKTVRQEWVNRLRNVTTYPEIETMNQEIYSLVLPTYKEQIKPLIREAVLKGGASMLKEQGVISTLPRIASVDSLKKTVSEEWVDYEAGRISNHNLNVLLGTLEQQAVRDIASGTIKSNPTIPTEESMIKMVGQYAGRSFNYGRNEAMMELKSVAETAGITKPIIAEYSSVLESSTCGPCKEADGIRVYVGSDKYLRMSPPNLCDGKDRCRCIWSIIMPEEQGYEEILKELAGGFSKAESTLLSNKLDSTLIEEIRQRM